MSVHIAHRLDIALLTLIKLVVEHLHLRLQHLNITFQTRNVHTDIINRLTLVGNLIVDHQKVLQTFLDVLFVSSQLTLLLLNLLAHLLLFLLEALHSHLLLLGGIGLLLRSLLRRCLFGLRRFSGGCLALGRRFLRRLGRDSRH